MNGIDDIETRHAALGDRHQAPYLRKRRVEAGDVSTKSGRGVYEYEE